MATQVAPTPVLKGKDAREVYEDMKRKPTPQEIREAEKRELLFKNVKRRGF
ncbi:MAG: hypothetical protein AB1500_07665 [Bacillota bacterium]